MDSKASPTRFSSSLIFPPRSSDFMGDSIGIFDEDQEKSMKSARFWPESAAIGPKPTFFMNPAWISVSGPQNGHATARRGVACGRWKGYMYSSTCRCGARGAGARRFSTSAAPSPCLVRGLLDVGLVPDHTIPVCIHTFVIPYTEIVHTGSAPGGRQCARWETVRQVGLQ